MESETSGNGHKVKNSISRICLLLFVLFFLMIGFIPTPKPIVIFPVILLVFALPPAILGRKWYRILGWCAVLLALEMIISAYRASKCHEDFNAERGSVLGGAQGSDITNDSVKPSPL